MGGIGKTTIAKALFRRNVYKFDCSSFVKDVRVNSSREKDICVLQEKILNDIQQIPRTKIKIKDCDYGLRLIKKAFFNKKVLLVLDDVDDIKQLEFLAASHKWFGQGSRIIITTRDKHVLVVAHANYKPNCLLVDQAIELFSRHAFQKNRPPEGYEDLSLRAIHYTGYLPLALKVFGSFFRGREAIILPNLKFVDVSIQILKARGCMSLEKIEDLSEVYEWLYKVWVFDCDRLLENQEHRRYLDKMLEQSFLK
nr:hypothetical protein [Tanacetum cinerariifolium]